MWRRKGVEEEKLVGRKSRWMWRRWTQQRRRLPLWQMMKKKEKENHLSLSGLVGASLGHLQMCW
jgi:hypothetical protein